MSSILPRQVVSAFREQNTLSVEIFGQPCTLFVPTNLEAVDKLGTYAKVTDLTFNSYETSVRIDWSRNKKRLAKYGIFVEDDVPIVAKFATDIVDASGFKTTVDVSRKSWFRLPVSFVPDWPGVAEFEILEPMIPYMQNQVVIQWYKIAPRRVKH